MRISSQTPILKSAEAVEQAYKGPHHLEDLVVNEVSLVTEPAILTDAESAAHAGFTVVKSAERQEPVPESVRKSLSMREGEDLATATRRLAAACQVKIAADTGNQDALWMSPLKVYADKVVMGFWWEDDALTLALEDRTAYYACYYAQAEDGAFVISRVAPVKVAISEVEAKAPMKKDAEPAAEAEVPSAEAEPVAEAAAAEVERAAEPEATEQAQVAAEPAQAAEPEAPAPGVGDMVKILVDSGRPFRLEFSAGHPVIVLDKDPEPAPVLRSVEPNPDVATLRAESTQLRKDLDALRVSMAKPATTDVVVIKSTNGGQSPSRPHDPLLAAAMLQTRNA